MPKAIYTPSPASLPRFLQHIQTAGVPAKLNLAYLTSVGFKSSNDRYLRSVLKGINFLDSSGVPTERWKNFRNTSQSKAG